MICHSITPHWFHSTTAILANSLPSPILRPQLTERADADGSRPRRTPRVVSQLYNSLQDLTPRRALIPPRAAIIPGRRDRVILGRPLRNGPSEGTARGEREGRRGGSVMITNRGTPYLDGGQRLATDEGNKIRTGKKHTYHRNRNRKRPPPLLHR
ncbi:unnamed protein product [Nezara viridula]|uniref:Uncharacterized protein n=1 Tax=Nezara viridula TaxID=85310 RepID=A0A9P0MQW0_NEZVI|nr:unnamed protein product [Nezara viridula]